MKVDRRDFLSSAGLVAGGAAAWAALGVFARPVVAASSPAGPVIETSAGRLRGTVQRGVHIFRGIPYGAATGGERRFMAPAPPAAWRGVRETVRYGASCPQQRVDYGSTAAEQPNPIAHLFTPGAQPTPDQTPPADDEDCLYLNVWSRGVGDGGGRPIMVWLHGGGFDSGSGSATMYDGTNLCLRGDVVVVTVNHRLNALGYLHLGDIGGERYADSGNVGMLDIVQALEWVRDNAEAFGGDPGRVTIFGESGGGRKTSTLLAMPSARGLFHGAIIQSGPGIHMQPRDRTHELALAILDELGLRRDQLDALHAVPAGRLIAAGQKVQQRRDQLSRQKGVYAQTSFGPTVDGRILPDYAFDPLPPEVSADVPILIGSCSHEMALFMQGEPGIWDRSITEADLRVRAELMAGNAADRVMQVYQTTYPDTSPTERLLLMATDRTYRFDSITLAQRKAAQERGAVFMYLFAWQTPVLDGRLYAPHGLDIPFAFDNLEQLPNMTAGALGASELAAKVSEAWISFARDGEPGHAGLPEWPAYTLGRRATMIFDRECHAENDPDAAVRKLWATL